jgi:hypothetical protein
VNLPKLIHQLGRFVLLIGPSRKIVLVILAFLVEVKPAMKRIFALIVLVGIVMGAVLTGCNQGPQTPAAPDTNAAPAAPSMPSTNK